MYALDFVDWSCGVCQCWQAKTHVFTCKLCRMVRWLIAVLSLQQRHQVAVPVRSMPTKCMRLPFQCTCFFHDEINVVRHLINPPMPPVRHVNWELCWSSRRVGILSSWFAISNSQTFRHSNESQSILRLHATLRLLSNERISGGHHFLKPVEDDKLRRKIAMSLRSNIPWHVLMS